MVLSTGLRSILGGPNFFKKKYLSKFFVAKMKKSSSRHSTGILQVPYSRLVQS